MNRSLKRTSNTKKILTAALVMGSTAAIAVVAMAIAPHMPGIIESVMSMLPHAPAVDGDIVQTTAKGVAHVAQAAADHGDKVDQLKTATQAVGKASQLVAEHSDKVGAEPVAKILRKAASAAQTASHFQAAAPVELSGDLVQELGTNANLANKVAELRTSGLPMDQAIEQARSVMSALPAPALN